MVVSRSVRPSVLRCVSTFFQSSLFCPRPYLAHLVSSPRLAPCFVFRFASTVRTVGHHARNSHVVRFHVNAPAAAHASPLPSFFLFDRPAPCPSTRGTFRYADGCPPSPGAHADRWAADALPWLQTGAARAESRPAPAAPGVTWRATAAPWSRVRRFARDGPGGHASSTGVRTCACSFCVYSVCFCCVTTAARAAGCVSRDCRLCSAVYMFCWLLIRMLNFVVLAVFARC